MRGKIFKLLVLCVAFALVSGCDILGWRTYSSPEGGFSIRLPAEPKGQRIILDTALGRNYLNIYMLNRKDDNFVYSIGYIDYPQELFKSNSAAKILEDGKDGAVRNIQGSLIRESNTSIKNYPGKEVIIEAGDGAVVIKARFFLVGQRMYQLMVTTDKKWVNAYQIGKFLDSFELTVNKKK